MYRLLLYEIQNRDLVSVDNQTLTLCLYQGFAEGKENVKPRHVSLTFRFADKIPPCIRDPNTALISVHLLFEVA